MFRAVRHYLLRRKLIRRSAAHRRGYEWAIEELKAGRNPFRYGDDIFHPFERGACDAMSDYYNFYLRNQI